MQVLEIIKSFTWIFVLLFSLLVIFLTYTKMKGSKLFRIGFGLFRAFIFFAIFYNPLIEQPRIYDNIILPFSGAVLLLAGIVLNIIGTRQLVKTKLGGVKGIPDKIITSGVYNIIRHPVNLGFIFIFCGWYLMWSGIYSLYFLPVLVIIFIIVSFYEERNLIKVFGDEYRNYKKNTGMFFPKLKRKK